MSINRIPRRPTDTCVVENRYWTVEQVAELTGMGVKWLRAQCHDGQIPHHRFGRSYRFTPKDIEELGAQNAYTPVPAVTREFVPLRSGPSGRSIA